jgi:hypothetical protein
VHAEHWWLLHACAAVLISSLIGYAMCLCNEGISLSADPGHRNFTLGQEHDDLIFRLRTPFTGENGSPGMVVHNTFSTNDVHTLVIVYDGSVLRIYIDSVSNLYLFEFSPGAVAFSLFSPVAASFYEGLQDPLVWTCLSSHRLMCDAQ